MMAVRTRQQEHWMPSVKSRIEFELLASLLGRNRQQPMALQEQTAAVAEGHLPVPFRESGHTEPGA